MVSLSTIANSSVLLILAICINLFDLVFKITFNKFNTNIAVFMGLNILDINYSVLFLIFLFFYYKNISNKIIIILQYALIFKLVFSTNLKGNFDSYLLQEQINSTLLVGLINIHPIIFYIFFTSNILFINSSIKNKIKFKKYTVYTA